MTTESTQPAQSQNEVWTVRRVIEWTTGHLKTNGSDSPRLDTEILLAFVRNCDRIQLYTRFDEPLTDDQRNRMRELVKRRAASEPVAYLVGYREFYGLDFQVTPDVLIPRPDTETLVLELIDIGKTITAPTILELGTGSGCIAISSAVNLPQSSVTTVDLSSQATEIARNNAAKHEMTNRIRFLQGDLFSPVPPSETFDIIASNPPYVAEEELDDLQTDVRLYEPRLALDGGPKGMVLLKKIIETAGNYLKPAGTLLLEISPEQADDVQQLIAAQADLTDACVLRDLSNQARVIKATKKTISQ